MQLPKNLVVVHQQEKPAEKAHDEVPNGTRVQKSSVYEQRDRDGDFGVLDDLIVVQMYKACEVD